MWDVPPGSGAILEPVDWQVASRREVENWGHRTVVTKDQVLDEIRRVAAANRGKPPGTAKFEDATRIGKSDWIRFWPRWGEALAEAGFAPNQLMRAMDDEAVLERLATLALELGRLPTIDDLKHQRHKDPSFPSKGVFRRLGTQSQLAAKLHQHCASKGHSPSVVAFCAEYSAQQPIASPIELYEQDATSFEDGYVYLVRSGRFYKIGRTNSVERRGYELAIQLPERVEEVHRIRTDDPPGIEHYWHRRFADKRKNGEWFELGRSDVAAFKRRSFM